MINLLSDNQRVDPTSPYELFTGNKVDYNTQLRISFGDYAECKNPNRKPINTISRRTDPCIALLPLLNAQGSFLFFDLDTKKQSLETDGNNFHFTKIFSNGVRISPKLKVKP